VSKLTSQINNHQSTIINRQSSILFVLGLRRSGPGRKGEHRTPNAERRTPNAERRTPNAERRTPNAEQKRRKKRKRSMSGHRKLLAGFA
jgi:hypothetical protein